MKIESVPLERLIPDPANPRTDITSEQVAELAQSIRQHGVKVPLIGFVTPEGVMVTDGHRRLLAARLAGKQEVPVVVFPQKPECAELLLTQLTINGHRQALNPVDELEAFVRLAKLKQWNAGDLAHHLAVSNAEVTRVLSIGKLSDSERQLVREGKLSKSAAYALSRMSPEQRATMARKAAAGEITRDQLNQQARKKGKSEEVKTQRVSCQLPGGTVSVQAPTGMNLPSLIDLLEELVRECRKARSQGWDISTVVRVLRDRSRAPGKGVTVHANP